MARALTLEIVTPDGVALLESGVDVVVLRRQEPRFAVGSEVAIYPGHAPLLLGLAAAPVRFAKAAESVEWTVAAGFAEVLHDRIVIVTPHCTPAAAPPRSTARQPLRLPGLG